MVLYRNAADSTSRSAGANWYTSLLGKSVEAEYYYYITQELAYKAHLLYKERDF